MEKEKEVGEEDGLDLLLKIYESQKKAMQQFEKQKQQQEMNTSSTSAAGVGGQSNKTSIIIEQPHNHNPTDGSTQGTEHTLKRKLPFSMTGKGAWDNIHTDNRSATATFTPATAARATALRGKSASGIDSKIGSDSGRGSVNDSSASGSVRGKSSFIDLVHKASEVLKREENCEATGDLLETAIKRGLKIPRPTWWPPQGFN